ncbi:hypothetical protein [Streptomyces chumphonensis]|uniref:hypothetical protein n=1 Tax=Streptomyces chumphonensis TaxID=1214925 RepID=UPI003D75C339
MPEPPITPSRIIPAGQPLPDLPGRHPAPGELPPWREPITAPPPPARPTAVLDQEQPDPAAVPVVVHVHVPLVVPPEPEPGPWWERLWDAAVRYVSPWRALVGLTLPLLPIPGTGYSTATTWAYTVAQAREAHIGTGYAVAGGALVLAGLWLHRRRSALSLAGLTTAFVGTFGAIHWFDPITWLTGVPLP